LSKFIDYIITTFSQTYFLKYFCREIALDGKILDTLNKKYIQILHNNIISKIKITPVKNRLHFLLGWKVSKLKLLVDIIINSVNILKLSKLSY